MIAVLVLVVGVIALVGLAACLRRVGAEERRVADEFARLGSALRPALVRLDAAQRRSREHTISDAP